MAASLVYGLVRSSPEKRIYYGILLAAFALRVGVVLLLQYSGLIPEKYFDDTARYLRVADEVFRGDLDEYSSYPEVFRNFVMLIAGVYFVVGPVPLTVQIFSALAGMLIVRNIYLATEDLAGCRAALLTAGLWAVLPSFVFVTAQSSRDTAVILMLTMIIRWMIGIERGEERRVVLKSGGCVLLAFGLCLFRAHQMIFVVASLAVGGLATFGWDRDKSRLTFWCLRGMGVSVVLVSWLLFLAGSHCFAELRYALYGMDKTFAGSLSASRLSFVHPENFKKLHKQTISKLQAKPEYKKVMEDKKAAEENYWAAKSEFEALQKKGAQNMIIFEMKEKMEAAKKDFERADENFKSLISEWRLTRDMKDIMTSKKFQAGPDDGTKLIFSDIVDTSYLDFALRFPLRMGVFLLSPLPWQSNSVFLKVAVAENLIFYLFLAAGVAGIRAMGHSRLGMSRFILAYILVSLAAYGLTSGNVGTAYRHRMQFIWLLFIPGSVYLASRFSALLDRMKRLSRPSA